MSLSRLESLRSVIPPADGLLTNSAGGVDPSDRWRIFAVAASATSVNSQQGVGLYVARLRARRASSHIYTHAHTAWLRDHIDGKWQRTWPRAYFSQNQRPINTPRQPGL